jgi:predicted permease
LRNIFKPILLDNDVGKSVTFLRPLAGFLIAASDDSIDLSKPSWKRCEGKELKGLPKMRKTVFTVAAIATLTASTAFAGGMEPPMMEPEIVVEESTGSSGGVVVPLILLVLLAAVASNN